MRIINRFIFYNVLSKKKKTEENTEQLEKLRNVKIGKIFKKLDYSKVR